MSSRGRSPGAMVCFALASILLFGGCAVHCADLCSAEDAQTAGYHDGSQGRHSCEFVHARTDGVAYRSGWQQGIERFCTEANGYQLGAQGAPFSKECPVAFATSYLDGYQSGYAIYLSQLEIEAMEHAIEAKSAELEQVYAALDAVSNRLAEPDANLARRLHQLDQSRVLGSQENSISRQLDELESEVTARKAQLSRQLNAYAFSD